MNCPDFRTDLVEFLDGRLPADRAAEARAHLDSCPACRRDEELHRRAWDLAGRIDALEPDPSFGPAVRRRLRRSRLSRFAGTVAAAAAVLVAFLAIRGAVSGPSADLEAALQRMESEDRRLLEDLARDRTWELADNIDVIRAYELLDRDDGAGPAEEGH